MSHAKDSFPDLERRILELEANVKKLKSALEHWRKWDAEYEALKEEVSAASEGAREAAELSRIREGFEGEMVDGKEVAEIIGSGRGRRSAEQIIGVLDRRLDYVGTNVRTLERKVAEAEREVDASREMGEDSGAADEPITEISEKLDEEGNVISHELWVPGSKESQLEELLGKAGLADEPKPPETGPESPLPAPRERRPQPATAARQRGAATAEPEREKKVIGQVGDDEPLPETSDEPEAISRAAKRVQEIMDTARGQEEMKEAPVLPADESPEDAALRQEMLKYGLGSTADGMGEVVAVMDDLRFGSSDEDGDGFNTFSDDDDDDEMDDDDDDDEAGEEDKWGRSTKRMVSDKYQERMLDLERRLGVQSRFTRKLAEEADESDESDVGRGIGRIVVKTEAEPAEEEASAEKKEKPPAPPAAQPVNGVLKASGGSGASTPKAKKSVRFAGSLDIAPEEEAGPGPKEGGARRPEPQARPVRDFIVEQTGASTIRPPAAAGDKARKPSRFKKMKMGNVSEPDDAWREAKPKVEEKSRAEEKKPVEKEDKPVVEGEKSNAKTPEIVQPLAWTETVPVKDPVFAETGDGFEDVGTTRREIVDEYHRQRRRMIDRDGGFLKEDKSEIQPVEETRRVSKFRAARLSRQ